MLSGMKIVPFAPELQKDWELLECVVVHRDAVIRVRTSTQHKYPDAGGQHGSKVLSYPAICSEYDSLEFRFTRCLLVRSWDEMALSIREADPEPQFEGRTFRRYSKSALLDLHSEIPTIGIHYRLRFSNEIIDVICEVPPAIILRAAPN
jgi:hypothetical protein